jgi:hypothetical protein
MTIVAKELPKGTLCQHSAFEKMSLEVSGNLCVHKTYPDPCPGLILHDFGRSEDIIFHDSEGSMNFVCMPQPAGDSSDTQSALGDQ